MKKSFLTLVILLASPVVFGASYDMPVDTPEQAEYAHFEMKNFTMSRDNKSLSFQYDLPLEVTGVLNTVKFQGPLDGSNLAKLNGDKANAVCDLVKSTCRIRYHDLKIDSDLIEARLKAMNLSPEELSGRLSVAAIFRGDPIGFLTFP